MGLALLAGQNACMFYGTPATFIVVCPLYDVYFTCPISFSVLKREFLTTVVKKYV